MTDHHARRFRRCLALLLLAPAVLSAPRAAAETTGTALVVGIDRYARKTDGTACSHAARGMRDRLREQGFTVKLLIDPPSVTLRKEIDGFAAQLGDASPGTVLAYACASAVATDARLFIMPSDTDLSGTVEPRTQGVVLQALFNALVSTGGTLFADLALPAGTPTGDAVRALQERLTAGLHLALALPDRGGAPAVGRSLASGAVRFDAGWSAVAPGMQAQPGLAPGGSAVFLPAPRHTARGRARRGG